MLQGRFERAEGLYRQAVDREPSLQRELVACQIGERVAREVLAMAAPIDRHGI